MRARRADGGDAIDRWCVSGYTVPAYPAYPAYPASGQGGFPW